MPKMHSFFDTYFIVDWSAANAPKRGKDSIWIGEVRREKSRLRTTAPANPPTRNEAVEFLANRFDKELRKGLRVFAGFDFPFGYPAGAAARLAGKPTWNAMWRRLAGAVEDDDANRSNRFDLADRWNREVFKRDVYWGRPHQHAYANLPAKKPGADAFRGLEYRIVERWRPPAKSVWQLAYNGAVGSQAILGMARLQKLRTRFKCQCAIWPFETKWDARLDAPIVIAEIYPSMIDPEYKAGDVKDAAQVRTLAKTYASLDRQGRFRTLISRPAGLSASDNRKVLAEEGWIVGAGHEGDGL